MPVHKRMLADAPRTLSYRDAMLLNKDLFQDKVVLDVGTGTGILSLFAAKAGASKVYAVEASTLAPLTKKNIEKNGYSDVITVINDRMENIELPEKVDMIISEWMGIMLFHENMLSSVLHARDRWLKPDGMMFPTQCNLYAAPIQDHMIREDSQYWNDIYGYDFSTFIEHSKASMCQSPSRTMLDETQVMAEKQTIISFDTRTCTVDQFDLMEKNLQFTANKDGHIDGFALWFDSIFEGNNNVVLDTSPFFDETHWKQVVTMLPNQIAVKENEIKKCNARFQRDGEAYILDYEIDNEFVRCRTDASTPTQAFAAV